MQARIAPAAIALLTAAISTGGCMGPAPSDAPPSRQVPRLFAGRYRAAETRPEKPTGTPDPRSSAILAGLHWLARHQSDDGRWDAAQFTDECGKLVKGRCDGQGYLEFDTGNTALALLAFLGGGYAPADRETGDGPGFGAVARKIVHCLISNQGADGQLRLKGRHDQQEDTKPMYGHAMAAMALAESYALTGDATLKGPAQKAADYLVAAQNPGKGWRYTARCGNNDSDVTGLCVLALKSAEWAGLNVPASAFAGAKAWFDEVPASDFDVGYNSKESIGQVVVPSKSQFFSDHDALVAVAVVCRVIMDGKRDDPRNQGVVERLIRDLPDWDHDKCDFHYWHWGSLALFLQNGPGGANWKSWNERLLNVLLAHQRREQDGCRAGSWDPCDRWGGEGGRVYATAINVLTLETSERYRLPGD